jgi:hypothetical protein
MNYLRGRSDPPYERSRRKSWLMSMGIAGGIVLALIGVLNVGLALGRRDQNVPTLREMDARFDALAARLDAKIDPMAKTLAELKIHDVLPRVDAANANSARAAADAVDARRRVEIIRRSIEGLNAKEAARGRITPLPLAEYPQ